MPVGKQAIRGAPFREARAKKYVPCLEPRQPRPAAYGINAARGPAPGSRATHRKPGGQD